MPKFGKFPLMVAATGAAGTAAVGLALADDVRWSLVALSVAIVGLTVLVYWSDKRRRHALLPKGKRKGQPTTQLDIVQRELGRMSVQLRELDSRSVASMEALRLELAHRDSTRSQE